MAPGWWKLAWPGEEGPVQEFGSAVIRKGLLAGLQDCRKQDSGSWQRVKSAYTADRSLTRCQELCSVPAALNGSWSLATYIQSWKVGEYRKLNRQ